jgi:hypothetical protein
MVSSFDFKVSSFGLANRAERQVAQLETRNFKLETNYGISLP